MVVLGQIPKVKHNLGLSKITPVLNEEREVTDMNDEKMLNEEPIHYIDDAEDMPPLESSTQKLEDTKENPTENMDEEEVSIYWKEVSMDEANRLPQHITFRQNHRSFS